MNAAAGQATPSEAASARERLREGLARLRDARDLPREACESLEEKLVSNTFNVVVVGQFKRGKTSFVNALLGEELLPVGVEAVLDGLENALRRGEAAQRSGASRADARRDALTASQCRLEAARAEIESALAALEAS